MQRFVNFFRSKSSGSENGRCWMIMQNGLTLAMLIAGVWQGEPGQHTWMMWLGLSLILLGTVVAMEGVRALGSQRTAGPAPPRQAVVVTTGIYSRIRHPLYSSLMLLGIGWSVFWESGLSLVFTVGLMVVLVNKARREEELLGARFPEYAAYAQHVKRFFPRFL